MDPQQPDYLAGLAEINAKLGDQDAAVRSFNKAIKINPTDAEFRIRLAELYQSMNRDNDALQVLQVAKPKIGLYTAWHFYRGFSFFRVGRYDEARQEFKLVLYDSQFKGPATFFLGNIAFAQGNFDEAAPYLSSAVQLGNTESNKAYNAYLYDYGLVLFKLGRFTDATQQFRASIERYSNDPLPWMFLGRCEEQLGNHQVAIEMLEKSIGIDPDFKIGYYELARLQQKYGDSHRAAELFEKISQIKKEELDQEESRAMKLRTTMGPQ